MASSTLDTAGNKIAKMLKISVSATNKYLARRALDQATGPANV